MAKLPELVVEIVKAQATLRPMSPEEIEEYIRRTASALRSVTAPPQIHAAATPPEVTPAEPTPVEPASPEYPPEPEALYETAEPQEAIRERALTVEEAARILGRSKLVVYRYIHQGRLLARRVGRSYLIRPEDVEALKQELGGTHRGTRRAMQGHTRRVPRRIPARRRHGARKS